MTGVRDWEGGRKEREKERRRRERDRDNKRHSSVIGVDSI